MIPGIEAVHTWEGGGGLTLNDLTGDFPRYRVLRIAGLHTRAEVEDVREPALGRLGEVVRPSFRRGKVVTYTGFVEALDLAQLRDAQAALAAFDSTDEEQMTIAQLPALGSITRFFRARCMLADGGEDEQQAAPTHVVPVHNADGSVTAKLTAYVRPLTIALRLSDPRVYDTAERNAQTSPLVTTAGTAPPFTPPVVIASSGPGGAVTFDVGGRSNVDPIVDIYGPIKNPVLINDTVGAQLRWKIELAAGSFIRLDFKRRTATLQGVSDVTGRRDRSSSTWWRRGVAGLLGGQQNTVRLRGDTIADPAHAEIRWYPAE